LAFVVVILYAHYKRGELPKASRHCLCARVLFWLRNLWDNPGYNLSEESAPGSPIFKWIYFGSTFKNKADNLRLWKVAVARWLMVNAYLRQLPISWLRD